jgi:hypothetical protein
VKAKVIKDYDPINHGITEDFLYNTDDWDLVELNYNIDSVSLKSWWDTILEQFPQCVFNFNDGFEKLNLEKSKEMVEEGFCGYYCGPIDGVTLAWPVERYEGLPPPYQCDPALFPEVNLSTFIDDAKIMPNYKFGYFEKLISELGVDAFRQVIVTRHHPGMYIRQHRDSKTLKLHIPIEAGEKSYFHFGKDRDRKYHMQVGKAYILNTGDWHGTSNDCEQFRSHLLSRVTRSNMLKLLSVVNT